MYSFRISFCGVARSLSQEMPRLSARARYMAMMMLAGALMVKLEAVRSISFSPEKASKMISISRRVSTATPTFPTSPAARGWSES
jgi:hypothetical protein